VTGTFSRQIGQDYLNQCVGPSVTELVLSDTVSFELDPAYARPTLRCAVRCRCESETNCSFLFHLYSKISDDPAVAQAAVEKNKKDLLSHANSLLQRITSDEKVALIPREIRAMAGFIGECARKTCPDKETSLIGGFIMLRYAFHLLCPAESVTLSHTTHHQVDQSVVGGSGIIRHVAAREEPVAQGQTKPHHAHQAHPKPFQRRRVWRQR
jgi:hypothetical protein